MFKLEKEINNNKDGELTISIQLMWGSKSD